VLLIAEKGEKSALWERAKADASKWRLLQEQKPGGAGPTDMSYYYKFPDNFLVGVGAFGIVMRAFEFLSNKPVALKLFPNATRENSVMRQNAENEVAAMRYIQLTHNDKCHENIICYQRHFKALVGANLLEKLTARSKQWWSNFRGLGLPFPQFDDTDWLEPQYFVETRYYPAESLEALMARTKAEDARHQITPLPGEEAKSIAWNLAMMASATGALAYLHSQDFYHRDLKPANMLIERESDLWLPSVVLIDVGTACERTHCSKTSKADDFVGTMKYATPNEYRKLLKIPIPGGGGARVVIGQQRTNTRPLAAFDVYALGACFHDWMKNSSSETPLTRSGPGYFHLSISAWSLIERMIEPDDTKRITAEEAHKAFQELSYTSGPFNPQKRAASTELKLIPED
jgi:serine/threonine protein kinase